MWIKSGRERVGIALGGRMQPWSGSPQKNGFWIDIAKKRVEGNAPQPKEVSARKFPRP